MSVKTLPGGTVYDLSIHLVLVTKYRKRVITQSIMTRLKEIVENTCKKWDCELVEFNGEPSSIHLLIDINPKAQISTLANNLKTVSSRLIRKEFPELNDKFCGKPVFWKLGYFVSSTGGARARLQTTLSNSDPPKSPLKGGTLTEFSPLFKGGRGGSPGLQTDPSLEAVKQYIQHQDSD